MAAPAAASAPVPLLTDAEPPQGYNLGPDSPLSQYKSPDESDNTQLKSKVITAVEAACDRSELILRLAAALGEWFCHLKDDASESHHILHCLVYRSLDPFNVI
jgi:hypothetical protein